MSIGLFNANLAGEPTILPHTGLVVPHARLRVTDLRPVPGSGGTRARLMLGEHFIGYINRRMIFVPVNAARIDSTDLERYAAHCRLPNGQAADLHGVLDALVREFEAALRHTVPTAEFDHNNECIGCGAAGPSDPRHPTCPFITGPTRHSSSAGAI
ncbi:hypothetical protein ACFQZ8_10025 [Micromonospora azadirachtae]|uniref:Uncharacterized protein n=1 Tax=Micromonospora azadirachtae TaxID=1970735 RepID=A0ABW3A028_9ACTN